jgi:long-chain acyl-CoA synthetase
MTMTEEHPASRSIGLSVSSLPEKVRVIAKATPRKVALREKVFGIWEETTYSGYWDMIQIVGAGLIELGIRPGDKVAIHSENRRAWLWSEFGAHAIKAVSVGIYPTNPAAEVEYLLHHSETKVLIAEDQEQVDKALEVKARLPNLTHIIYIEPRGVTQYDDPELISWDQFLELGKARLDTEPSLISDLVDSIDPETMCSIIYTSGTTGPPKGAMISHRNLVWVMDHVTEALVGYEPKSGEILSYLPICHVAEKLYSEFIALHVEGTVNFAESIETVAQDLQEVQPTLFLGVPRIWEKMQAGVLIRMADATWLKKACFAGGFRVGMKNADRILAKGRRGIWGSFLHGVFYVLAYRSLKEKLGMRHCVSAVSGAAPIAPEIIKFFMAIGVPIREGYGMTENAAYASFNPHDNIKLGTVGVPNPNCEITMSEQSEILIRHPGVFMGYYEDEAATASTLDSEGWLHTGDVGEWDGDHFRIVDRMKDIIITSGGKNISPSEIENKLKVSPFIKEAIVIGDRRKYVSALIGIEFDIVSNWALRRNIAFTTYRDLSEKKEVLELIEDVVKGVNEELAQVEQVKEFRMIPKELDQDDGELTATQKVKRSHIEEKFSDLIADVYGVA